MVVSIPSSLLSPPVSHLIQTFQQGGSRTFIALVIVTITSLVGKLAWDGKHPKAGASNSKKKDKGKKRRDRSPYKSSVGRPEHHDPDEVSRCCSVFED
jgi:hypothetical protein